MLKKIISIILVISMLFTTACSNSSTNVDQSVSWLIGEESPEPSIGNKGDMYLNTKTYDIYQKNSNAWRLVGNIQGSSGAKGEIGEDGKTPVFQMDGQRLQWKYEGDVSWSNLFNFDNSTSELSWLVGAKTPDGSYGKVGDMYINTKTYDLYQKSDNSWNLVCNIKNNSSSVSSGEKGDKGEDGKTPVFQMDGQKLQWKYVGEETFNDLIEIINGADGADGSMWFTGNGEPDGSIIAKAGDLYLDKETSGVYKYSGSAWTLETSIKGNDGADGVDGADGADGNDGVDGKTPEFRMNNRMLQWKYTDDEDWIDLIEIGSVEDTSVLKAKPVIFDTDFWTDTDDLSAIRILLWAEQEGMCDIVGVIVDAVNSKSAKAIGRYLDYEGRGDLPVALEKSANDFDGTPCYFDTMINNWNYGLYNSNDDAEDENSGEYYIKLLNNVPDGEKCNIICVGYMTALAGLMNKAEAEESVMDLVKNKVDKIYIMAGKYPNGSENNITRTARSRQAGYDAITKIPESIDVIFLGYEAGVSVKSGNKTGSEIGEFDLLYKAMVAHGNGTNANSSWDPMTTLLAVYDDADAAGYKLVRGTNTVNPTNGANTFTENETGHHYYVTKKYPDGWYVHAIDSILARNAWPHRKTGRVQYVPVQEEFTLTGITIKSTPSKTTYYVGEEFSSSGMVVSASLIGNTSGKTKNENVYSYTTSQTEPFAEAGIKTITISYTLGEVTKTADIDVTVLEPSTFDVTVNTTNGTNTSLTSITQGQKGEVTITPSTGYVLPDSITVENADYTYDRDTGKIEISNPTDNVTISIVCIQLQERTITVNITNGTYTGPSVLTTTATITITPSTGYALPENIVVTEATYTWNANTGVIVLSNPTANVLINVTCPIEIDDSYIAIELNGTENWAFNNDTEPNTYGIYNCYLIDSTIVPKTNELALTGTIPTDAYCSWGSDWKCNDSTSRQAQTKKCFGYHSGDPSLYFRFDSSVATSVATFKEYLSEHPVTLYFLKSGKVAKKYSITNNVTNGSISGDNSIGVCIPASLKLTASAGYVLPESISVTGATYTYSKETGDISLSSPTGAVTITAVCPSAPLVERSITKNVTRGSSSGPDKATGTATITITPTTGCNLPTTIMVVGANYTWDSTTGTINLSNIYADVTITVVCEDPNEDYIAVILDGDENWKFNDTYEPNSNGYYNCYLIDDSVVPNRLTISMNGFGRCADAHCSNTYWVNQTTVVDRSAQNAPCFGYYKETTDTGSGNGNSIYFRFTKDITGYASEVNSIEAFKTYLQANPLTLYFKKAAN